MCVYGINKVVRFWSAVEMDRCVILCMYIYMYVECSIKTICDERIFTTLNFILIVDNLTTNLQGEAQAGNATQNIHPPLMKSTHITILSQFGTR